jgi:hypothetical protein
MAERPKALTKDLKIRKGKKSQTYLHRLKKKDGTIQDS